MKQYLQLLRFPNLLFIAFVQFAMSEAVILPLLMTYGFDAGMSSSRLLLLILSTILIAAGGYVLNDYFDVKIDTINRPDKMIVGKTIPRASAMRYYQILTALGLLSGFILAFQVKSFALGFIFLVVPGMLWFYSATYKRQFLTGNIIVAFASALSVLLPAILELAVLESQYGKLIFETPIPKQIYAWVGGFAVFAFFCTLLREIIKDAEDIAGDREMECRTLPIVWGIKKTKIIVYCLILLIVAGLLAADFFLIDFSNSLTTRYLIFGLIIPFVCLGYLIFKAENAHDFHQTSTLSKVIMLLGVSYSFVFYFLQAQQYHFPIFHIFMVQ
jgi:4-hydroxybenzoate polyprenyltransferase